MYCICIFKLIYNFTLSLIQLTKGNAFVMDNCVSKQAVCSSLKSLGFGEKILVHFEGVPLKYLLQIKHELIQLHHQLYANEKSKKFIENIDKRIDAERQFVFMMLIHQNFNDFYLIQEAPLLLEHSIQALNGSDVEIGFMVHQKICQEATEQNTSYDELAKQLQRKYN